MNYDFQYLIDKIKSANFSEHPFKHIYIENFFSNEHFLEIIKSQEISPQMKKNDEELIDGLYKKGFKAISFPGCITDRKKYIDWHSGNKNISHHSACEGFGMTLRLYNPESSILKSIDQFLSGEDFNKAIANKFEIDFDS